LSFVFSAAATHTSQLPGRSTQTVDYGPQVDMLVFTLLYICDTALLV